MTDFAPLHVGELELGAPIGDLDTPARPDGTRYSRSRLLVRLHRIPLGFATVDLSDGRAGRNDLAAAVESQLGGQVRAHARADGLRADGLGADGLPAPESPDCAQPGPYGDVSEPATVVVCAKDPGDSLRLTITSLLDGEVPPAEVLLVDNASKTDAVRRLASEIGSDRVRCVEEPIPGLSRARNRGLTEAKTDLVALTDDDVRVDAAWLGALVRGFTRAPRVGCVTGILPSAELETAGQAFLDARVYWSANTQRQLFDLAENRPEDPSFPYSTGRIGTGANFALRRSALSDIGPFDEALGAGTPSRGGEDLDFFLRVILAGWTIAYEPSAIAWHAFLRVSDDDLRNQIYDYGAGASAYAFKHVCRPRTAVDLARRLPATFARLTKRTAEAGRTTAPIARVGLMELRGMVAGPAGYVRGRAQRRGVPPVLAGA